MPQQSTTQAPQPLTSPQRSLGVPIRLGHDDLAKVSGAGETAQSPHNTW